MKRRIEPRKTERRAAMPPRKGYLNANPEAMEALLLFFNYPLKPPPFKKENGECYWGLGGNVKEDDDE